MIGDDLPWGGTAIIIRNFVDGRPHPHDAGGMEHDAQKQQQSDGDPGDTRRAAMRAVKFHHQILLLSKSGIGGGAQHPLGFRLKGFVPSSARNVQREFLFADPQERLFVMTP